MIQEFMPTSKAGVMYTNVGRGLCVITANFGLCKTAVVDDGSPCDKYVLHATRTLPDGKRAPYRASDTRQRSFTLVQRTVAPNKRPLRVRDATADMYEDVPTSEPVLNSTELAELFELGQVLQQFCHGKPLEIEWGYSDAGRPFVLQYRPITGGANQMFPNATVYDGTQVGESYSGFCLCVSDASFDLFDVRLIVDTNTEQAWSCQ
jgi:hypothetical protein